ncbi:MULTISPECIES: lysoplasmalogenase family protein [unclassified Variovorax]|uniref:lysoplasmalogenase family protein n=1 Tax=unclassified Variovorax TaxID=663243 RepID=UPI0008ABCC70|nr:MULTISPECIES: lysoplasmalogenase family protein [unclassified Variovorax]SEK11541.1 Sterol desaturase/sphingolipid hydroxylase, fatty acid hydroxylase superfamily [Variovorax sp. OK202]SFD75161.1 Sterol desaturase/sphingolipid hydroxylase, fatty acid hydroxylase superfamily [Variovorax sp. OK212]
MRPGQIIVLATPVFLLLIALEFAVGRVRAKRGTGQDTYRLADAVNSIGLGMLSQISAVLTGLLRIGIYTAVYSAVALFPQEAARDFWSAWYGWLLALVFYDLCYYWLHRMGHESAVLWAAHVVHHQSQHYNLSTALRQTSSGALLGWVFYLPMAVAGVPPLVFGVVALVDLLYQFWVHTEQVGKLGWFDRWFCSPSNHRVHHAVNDRYLDRNYGGILIVWDRLFGTFREEDERCVYGTRGELRSWDPLWANAEVYCGLARDSWHARSWADKLRVWFKPPGWRPADVAERFPKTMFDISKVTRYEPEVGRGVQWFAGLQFVVLLGLVAVFLWFSDTVPLPQAAVWLAALTAGLWAVGGVLQGRLTVTEVLLMEASALATASAALGLEGLHHVCKPLALGIAIFLVARRAMVRGGVTAFDGMLLAGLVASLAGDVLLMGSARLFVPGLVCFLLAHLAYIALFRIGVGLFPRRGVLAVTLLIGAGMYAFLWQGGLPVALRVPVGVYVVVIACMAAQAIGRAAVLRRRDPAAPWVAVGACFFMLSDSLLATNRFVMPLPLASLWVLGTYYAAQILIVRHARQAA